MEKLTLGNILESYVHTMMQFILLYNIYCVLGHSDSNITLGLKGSLENNLVHTFLCSLHVVFMCIPRSHVL